MLEYRKITSHASVCLIAMIMTSYANSEEIAPFRLTGVDGEVYTRFLSDEYTSKNSGEETSHREGTATEVGLDLNLHSYIYHPNFIRLDFGGGPVWFNYTYDSNTVDESGDEQFLNLHARANILEKKPYPMRLFYDRRYSISPYAVQDRMLLRREKYGANLKLRKPLSPAQVIFDIRHTQTDGDNRQRITDEKTDQASVEVTGDLGGNGNGRLKYSWTKRESASGSTALPIDPTTRTVQLMDARTKHLFGENEWIRFTNYLTYRIQDDQPELKSFRYTPKINLTHTDNLSSSYRYSYLNKTVNEIDTTSHAFDFGVNHKALDRRLNTNLNLHTDKYDTEGLEQTYSRGDLRLSYLQPFPEFKIRYTGGWGADYTDRVGDNVAVVDETHTLDSFNSFTLDNKNVIQSTVVVKNDTGTQTFIEGIHYDLVLEVDVTRIQWIDLDDIPIRVRVDYQYQSGGTAEFTSINQLYRIDLTRGNLLKLYAQYRSLERNLESGSPTIPLNSHDTQTVGLRVEYPLQNSWTVGGRMEHENHDADIGTYRSDSAGVYVKFPDVLKGNVRLSADKRQVDNLDSPEDVDLTRYALRYQARPWYRTTLSVDLTDETDTGGTRKRENTRASARLSWKYRQIVLSAEARYSQDTFGDNERDRSSIDLSLARKF